MFRLPKALHIIHHSFPGGGAYIALKEGLSVGIALPTYARLKWKPGS